MKLNPDCIRDILLTIEDKSKFNGHIVFNEDDWLLPKYSFDEIQYHLQQCNMSDLITGFACSDLGEILIVVDLSPKGHEFLANIREDKNWNKVKKRCDKVGSRSLNVITQIASNVIAEVVKAQMGLN